MKVTLLGTGCPQCSPKRMGPSNLIEQGDLAFLVDCGSGVTQRLVAAGSSSAAIDALFLTHLHSDHIIDLYQLIISSWHQGRARPHKVYGPKGTRHFVEGLMELWRPERELRIAHEQRNSIAAFDLEVVELAGGENLSFGGVTIEVVEVEHQPVKSAFGYVIKAVEQKAVFSGDTRYCPALIEAARGADLLVHECFIHRELPVVEGVRTARTAEAVASYHTLSEEVGKVAEQAGVFLLLLNHFVPVEFDKAALLAEVAKDFQGAFVIGEDLMSYDLDSRSLSHREGVIRFPV